MSIYPPRMRFAGRRSTAAVDMFALGTAVTLILFSSCKEPRAVLRSAGLRLCWSKAKEVENNLPQPLHSVPIPRLSRRNLGPTYSVLPLPDARMGRSSSMQISVNTKVSNHRICQFRALFVSDRFIPFQLNWNHSKLNFSNHIPYAFQVIHEQCSCSWRNGVQQCRWNTKYDGRGPGMQNTLQARLSLKRRHLFTHWQYERRWWL